MRPVAKAGLVALGYIAAFAIALLVVGTYLATTSSPDRQGGMAAFGDPAFWLTLSIASLAAASTSVAAVLIYAPPRAFDPPSLVHSWSALAVLRILAAPLFAMFWLLSGLFAPNRSSRLSLIAASTIEMAVFAYVAFRWFHPLHG